MLNCKCFLCTNFIYGIIFKKLDMVQKLNNSTNSNTIGIRQSQVTANENECWRPAYQNLQKEHLTLKEKYRQSGCVIAKMKRESGKKDKTIAKMKRESGKKDKTIAKMKRESGKKDKTIAKMKRESGKKDKTIAKLTEALEKAKRRLAIVDSAHKPTSHQMFKEMRKAQAAEDAAKKKKRPGQPPGHKGTTDTRPRTHTVRARVNICKCGGKWVRVTEITERDIIDIKKIEYTKTKMVFVAGNCMECGRSVKGDLLKDDVEAIQDGNGGDKPDAGGEWRRQAGCGRPHSRGWEVASCK